MTSFMTYASIGLSSTSSTVFRAASRGLLSSGCWLRSVSRWNCEAESGSSAGSRSLEPYASAVLLHHTLADRETDPAPRILIAAVQAFEESEYPLGILRFNSDPVVSHRKHAPAVAVVGCDMHTRHLLIAIFDGITDQILK